MLENLEAIEKYDKKDIMTYKIFILNSWSHFCNRKYIVWTCSEWERQMETQAESEMGKYKIKGYK